MFVFNASLRQNNIMDNAFLFKLHQIIAPSPREMYFAVCSVACRVDKYLTSQFTTLANSSLAEAPCNWINFD